ncbi:MAG TPA: 6-phospho-beta-glucosidase [Actinomycetales bacterium]|nr:6-phospho-beta-glucosidase [Actinomycetales bacterium]
MRLCMIGGGGFRTPQMFQALAADPDGLITELVLYDTDGERLKVIEGVIAQMDQREGKLAVRTTQDLVEAVTGADFIFTTLRVGGTEARALDEEIALEHGVLGQETVGVGGLAYALRTIPVARSIAETIAEHAPGAWTINFTNPVGVITQAMRESLGDRVVGICDTPIGLINRIAAITGTTVTRFDYAGINHLGWLRGVWGKYEEDRSGREVDLLSMVLEDDDLLGQIEEAEWLGFDIVRSIHRLPNEYLYYYMYPREAVERISGRTTRGRQVADAQHEFYTSAAAEPERALELWEAALREREETYGSETREDPDERRSAEEIALGGYQKVAVQLMRALAGVDEPNRMVLNVQNTPGTGRLIRQLSRRSVVEVACAVGLNYVTPYPVERFHSEFAGLMVQVRGCDELLLRATERKDRAAAVRAFAIHPLVDSLNVARKLLDAYCERIPGVAEAIGAK